MISEAKHKPKKATPSAGIGYQTNMSRRLKLLWGSSYNEDLLMHALEFMALCDGRLRGSNHNGDLLVHALGVCGSYRLRLRFPHMGPRVSGGIIDDNDFSTQALRFRHELKGSSPIADSRVHDRLGPRVHERSRVRTSSKMGYPLVKALEVQHVLRGLFL
ncbi:uncharacterized protein G2W53_027148 [Senna tora]|uniref:Uncharacterized protein n=1 Tax=Senna tora TaxID=362788 RepID=A0A834TGK5_9FABA|nr:uncharacterized protein G2W53_027148 [Senna tora]